MSVSVAGTGGAISGLSVLGAVGWFPGAGAGGNASADAVDQGSWLVARLWNTPAVLTNTPLPAGRYRFILTLDGEATLEWAGRSHTISPHQFVVIDGREKITTRNTVLWARMEWHIHLPLLRDSTLLARTGHVTDISNDFEQLVAAVTNTISIDPAFADSAGGPHLLPALQALTTAVLNDAHGEPAHLTPSQNAVLTAARRYIDQHFTDPTMTATGIADGISVSPAYLYRVFALADSSPRKELQQRRAAAAQLLLDAIPVRGKGSLESIARRAGFTSTRQMHAAIQHSAIPNATADHAPSSRAS